MSGPQLLMVCAIGQWNNAALSIQDYLSLALLFGGVAFYVIYQYFVYLYQHGKYLTAYRGAFNHLNLFIALVFIFDVVIGSRFPYSHAVSGFLIYGSVTLYNAIKPQRTLRYLGYSTGIMVIIWFGLNATVLPETLFLITQGVFFLMVFAIIVGWVLWFRNPQYSQFLKFLYFSTLFILYMGIVFTTLLNGLIMVSLVGLFAFFVKRPLTKSQAVFSRNHSLSKA